MGIRSNGTTYTQVDFGSTFTTDVMTFAFSVHLYGMTSIKTAWCMTDSATTSQFIAFFFENHIGTGKFRQYINHSHATTKGEWRSDANPNNYGFTDPGYQLRHAISLDLSSSPTVTVKWYTNGAVNAFTEVTTPDGTLDQGFDRVNLLADASGGGQLPAGLQDLAIWTKAYGNDDLRALSAWPAWSPQYFPDDLFFHWDGQDEFQDSVATSYNTYIDQVDPGGTTFTESGSPTKGFPIPLLRPAAPLIMPLTASEEPPPGGDGAGGWIAPQIGLVGGGRERK